MLGGRLRRSFDGSATAVRITAILTAVGCCLAAAAAYATTRAVSPGPAEDGQRSPLRPRIYGHPDPVTTKTTAWFAFAQPGRPARSARSGSPPRMECKLDAGPWQACTAPVTVTELGLGGHRFAVRAVNRAGDSGPPAESTWRRVAARAAQAIAPVPPFAERIRRVPARPGPAPLQPRPATTPAETAPVEEPGAPPGGLPFALRQIGTLGDLYPGAPAQTIGVLVENPNESPLTLTSLTASIAEDPPDCPAAENFILSPAAVSPAAPLVVVGESTVSLPGAGIAGPTIAMANLPRSQDGCEGDELDIALSGEAGG